MERSRSSAMMSLVNDTRLMANDVESDGVGLATPSKAMERGHSDRAMVGDKDTKINELLGGRSTVGPPTTPWGHGDAQQGLSKDPQSDWTAGGRKGPMTKRPQDGGQLNGLSGHSTVVHRP